MRATGLTLAVCLAGTFGVAVTGLCAPTAAVSNRAAPLSASDMPVHPGLKAGRPMPNAYGDEPGTSRAAGSRHDRSSGESESAGHALSPGVLHDGYTARSAVLDTVGSAHDDAAPDAPGLGLKLRPLTDAERQKFAVDNGGLVVTRVEPGAGMRAGFHPGDVVLSLGGVDVMSADQFCKLLQEMPRDRPVPVLVRRPGSNLFLPLGAPARR